MSDPLVSVITPTYQAGARLRRCLENVRGQTYPNVEHVVIDGGSTDGTVELLSQAPGVTWVSEPDGGQSDGLNKGLRIARGSIVGWLNADDQLAPDTVERTVALMRARPEVGWSFGSVRVTGDVPDYVLRPPRRLARRHFFRGTPVAQPGSFFARWALDRVGPLATDLHFAMDLDLWCRFFVAGVPAARLDMVTAIFEVHADSKSGSVAHHLFVEDQAEALHRNGLADVAASTYGRAAVLRSWTGRHVDRSVLAAELDYVRQRWGERVDLELPLRAGVRTEAALLLAKAGDLRGLVLLADPRIWGLAAGRERMLAAAQAWISRSIRRSDPPPTAYDRG